ncbi:MAG TPA: hypothetical protein VHC22_06625 [Pirellulales bacterium]|nr:hypothetical protein [Pirellulales bacterium]
MLRKKRSLTLESLESRELKAGDVAANLQNGSLYLTEAAGQAGKDNSVIVSELPNGLVRVQGNATNDGSVSKVDGSAYQDFRVTGSLNVNFGAGNDKVVLGGEGVPAMSPIVSAVNIDVSAPQPVNAQVAPAIATAATNAAVTTPVVSDIDDVVVWGVHVAGSMSINTGIGSDYVFISNANIGTAGSGNLSINTGIGSDGVDIENGSGFINGSVTVQMNGLSSDVDGATLDGVYNQGSIQVNTGAGNDSVHLTDIGSYANVNLSTGAGNDSVTLTNVYATDEIMASLGDGNDSLNVDYLTSKYIDLDGGAGTNSLTISKNLFGVGGGTDTLNEIGWAYINGRYVPPRTVGAAGAY